MTKFFSVNLLPLCSEALAVDKVVRGEVNSHYVTIAHLMYKNVNALLIDCFTHQARGS